MQPKSIAAENPDCPEVSTVSPPRNANCALYATHDILLTLLSKDMVSHAIPQTGSNLKIYDKEINTLRVNSKYYRRGAKAHLLRLEEWVQMLPLLPEACLLLFNWPLLDTWSASERTFSLASEANVQSMLEHLLDKSTTTTLLCSAGFWATSGIPKVKLRTVLNLFA